MSTNNSISETLLSSSELAPPSGLYLALPYGSESTPSATHHAYLLYWPEESTWDDKAAPSVRRNRVMFMRLVFFAIKWQALLVFHCRSRYLSKLADQTIALISTEQANSMVWGTSDRSPGIPAELTQGNARSRISSFEVSRVSNLEDVVAAPGFEVSQAMS